MRLWSLHPKYLDAKGLVALWRETLLAKHVLESKTKGYREHPQLIRFKRCDKPLNAINHYLAEIYDEAERRGYKFSADKFDRELKCGKITVTRGQIGFETEHLLKKLLIRDPERYASFRRIKVVENHPIFKVVDGEIESWEVI